MQQTNRYRHFCPMAQALERLGERWAFLIIRDLLPGQQRFTDLLASCGGITPRQLSARLRQLEADGIIERDREPGRREVRYRLTPSGEALRPAVEAMHLWGIRHIARGPAPDEPVRPDTLLNGTRLAIAAAERQPAAPVRWTWRFPDEPHTIVYDGTTWTLTAGEDPEADVVVDTTPRDWAMYVASDGDLGDRRRTRVLGGRASTKDFFRVFPGLRPTAGASKRGAAATPGTGE